MEAGDGEKTGESQPAPQTQQLCRFFSQGRHCNFGKKCKFLHVRDGVSAHEKDMIKTPSQSDVTHPNSEDPGENTGQRPPASNNPRAALAGGRRPCRYFIAGHCTMEDRCRFWHPPPFPSVDDLPVPGNHTRPAQRMPPVPRPGILHEVKLCELTEDVTKELRDTEIKQLKKRFPKDQLIIQEQSDGKVTYYRMAVEATDPDWPFDLKEIEIMVSFPENYPQEVFTLDIPLDQDLPPVMSKHVQQASLEWLQAKHATNQLMGKVELLFRPFLRWLDRSLERLFTEGARQLKKDIDLEKAGLQFIPYQELQATVCEKSQNDDSSDTAPGEDEDAERKIDKTEAEGSVEGGMLVQQEDPGYVEGQQEEASHLVENIKISDPRRGTEVKLMGLRLGENTATVAAQQITVCLQCNRCKVTADLTLTGRAPCTAQCEKCSASINAAFRPCMLHHYSDVLGYLDLHNASPTDLVLQDCVLIVGCLNCSQEGPVQDLPYGQTKEFNCEHCHNKLSILAESTKFQYIQPRVIKRDSGAATYKAFRDPAVQKGKPLPEKGTCKHFKQSHRWLRFPCCGRAYPCDACHDEDQDHPMELATRMLCGYCAKEQPYGNGKPCISCGSMMTRGTRSSHWEGGLGCRNKSKMSRNDRQKYSNMNKTVSRKAVSEKK
ncbi:znF_C3H1 and zf-CHY domain-containing protein [Anabas testudineus]|uniref:Nucleoporin NUP42 n=1 Tax=Anabas testudineus TaxID=64144 RepID=A0A3Q1HWW0_ANATE|nr:znF_C3H1 and zf-CHY domain-containing protein [Anabas testudineus]